MHFFDILKTKNKPLGNVCQVCGEIHNKLPAIGFNTPDNYNSLDDKEKSEIADISNDFCVITYDDQTDRFIRTVLTILTNDACDELDYGVWVSLSEQSYKEYKSDFNRNIGGKTYFGFICNEINDYDQSTVGLHVNVNTRTDGNRPEITPHQIEHKLFEDWENGISINEAEKRINRM